MLPLSLMDSLNKNQFLLLVLLVTFVTSIATGIMTYSLLQGAPIEVTRTINQVIEKTIQQVASTTNIIISTPGKINSTVVVNEQDQVVNAIQKNIQSIVRIQEKNPLEDTTNFFAFGILVNKNGQIAVPKKEITSGNEYVATLFDGTLLDLNPVGVDRNTSYILFVPLKPINNKTSFIPVTFANSDPQLGQNVISIGGNTVNAIAVERVISVGTKIGTVGSTTGKFISSIDTDISSKDIVFGSPIFTISGDIIGIENSVDVSKTFTSINVLKRDLPTLIQSIP